MSKVQFSLARRITVLLGALDLLLLFVAGAAYWKLREADGRYARLFEADTRALLAIPRINVALHDAARVSAQRFNATSLEEASRLDRELGVIRKRMAQETAGLRTSMPDYTAVSADFDRAFADLLGIAQRARDGLGARPSESARAASRQQFWNQFERLRTFLQALGDQIRDRMLDEARRAEQLSNHIIRRTLLVAVIALAGGLVLAQVWVWRSIALPLRDLVTTVRRLMSGDLNVSIPGGGRTDEIGLLASALGVFRQNLERKRELETADREHLARLERSEADQRQSRKLLQSVTDNAEAFIFVKDLEGRYLFVNQLYMNLLKRPASEILGKSAYELFSADAARGFTTGEAEVIAEGKPRIGQATMIGDDGETRHFLAHKFPLFDEHGRMFGVGGVSTDVTAIKRTEEELARARDAAEAANRAKSAFVATMSHEIRTPMNAVINLTSLALDGELAPRPRQYVSVAHSSARGLLALLNDILDFSKIEAGRLELETAPFGLRHLLEEVGDSFRGRVMETRLEFGVLVGDEVPDRLVGDTLRLRQVLTNLLGNAFKFTERGQVAVRVSVEEPLVAFEGGERRVTLRFTVSDTGIGIPAEKQGLLFEAFNQADTSITRKFGGTGLGLAISKRLVDLMGGAIHVTSEPGRGSEFSFTARFGVAPETVALPEPSASLPRDLQHTRALVAAGSELTRELLVRTLRRFGLTAEGVDSARTAMDRFRSAQRGSEAFGLVVVDWVLADRPGLELVRDWQALPGAEDVPVVVVSAYVGEDEERTARAAGARAFVPKPISGSMLFDAVIEATRLRPEWRSTQPAPAGEARSLAGRRLLVAEDNDANQFVIREILENAGVVVTIAADGAEALEALARESFELVLMDMQMPGIDGLEATRRIRAREAGTGHRTPIVALTANAMKADMDACFAAGMDDYVAKPIERHALFATLGRWLPAPAEGPAEDASPDDETRETIPAVLPEDREDPRAEEPVTPAPASVPARISGLADPVPTAAEVTRPSSEPVDAPPSGPVESGSPASAESDPPSDGRHPAPVSAEAVIPATAGEVVSPVVAAPATPIAPPPTPPVEDSVSVKTTEPAVVSEEPTPAPTKPKAPRRKRVATENQLDLLAAPVPAAVNPDGALREMVAAGRLPGVDLEDARQRLGLSPQAITRMLRQFAQGQERIVRELRVAIEGEDREEARRLAHSLAGAAGNLSAHDLRRHAKTLELAIKFGQDSLSGMLEEVETEAARVFAGIRLLDETAPAPSPAPPSAKSASPESTLDATARDELRRLAGHLDFGDLDGIQKSLDLLRARPRPASIDADWRRLEQQIEGFQHAEAAALARRLATAPGSPG